MSFNIQDSFIQLLPIADQQQKEDTGFYTYDGDKCNLHVLNTLFFEKKQIKTIKRVKKPLGAGQLAGRWNLIEKKKYHWFLQIHRSHFQNKHLRRMDKIFKSMAAFIGSRAADQCRSHHQKMQKKYKSFYNIIYNLRLTHYNSVQAGQIMQDFTSDGMTSLNSLINNFPANCGNKQINKEVKEDKEEEDLKENIQYNFFGDQQLGLQQFVFPDITF